MAAPKHQVKRAPWVLPGVKQIVSNYILQKLKLIIAMFVQYKTL